MILVLGATGTTGGEVARQLIAKGQKPRLLVRDPAKAAAFRGKAELVQGDLAQADSLGRAFDGVEKLYLVSTGVNGPDLEARAIGAAKKAGVRHVVKLSVVGADAPKFAFARWHARSEAALRESGLAFTMLRPGNFATNALGWVPTIKSDGAIYQPTGDGKWASIDPEDIGAVAVAALTAPGHEGKAYTLTGPESLSGAQYAAKLSAVAGKPIKFVDVPPQAAREAMARSGMPPAYLEALMELLAAMKAGATDFVSNDVEKVLGRKPRTFDEWARRNAAAFR